MEKEQSQNNQKNVSEKEEEVKASSGQTLENSQADELAADGSSQNPSQEAKEEEKNPEEKIMHMPMCMHMYMCYGYVHAAPP